MTRRDELRKNRAEVIIAEVKTKLTNSTTDLLKVGKLLSEFKLKRLYTVFDHTSMDKFIEHSSLGITVSSAKKLMTVIERATALDIMVEEMEQTTLPKLSVIFGLSPRKHADNITSLVAESSKLSIDDLRKRVRELNGPRAESKFTTIPIPVEVADAVKKIRKTMNLSTVDALRHYFVNGVMSLEAKHTRTVAS